MTRTLGFIGLGSIGFPMAANLAGAGYEVVVFDTRREALDAADKLGMTPAASVQDVAGRADVVFLSLPTPQIVERVVLDADGVMAGSAVRCLIDLSTSGPRTAIRLAERLAARGVASLEAPVSGGVGGARAAKLAIMVSGPNWAYDDVVGLLKQLGHPVFVGEGAGLAQTMKLVNNMVSGAALAITAEAMVMGAKAGIAPEVMIEVLNAGSARNTATLDKFPKAVLTGTYDYGFGAELMLKDNTLFLEEAEAMGLELPACREMRARWAQTVDQFGACDFTAIARVVEQAAGVSLQARRRA